MAGMGHNSGDGGLLRTVDVYAEIRRACDLAGGQRRWAEAHGLSPQHVNDVLACRREISPRILSALGLVKVERYARASISRRSGAAETQEPGARAA